MDQNRLPADWGWKVTCPSGRGFDDDSVDYAASLRDHRHILIEETPGVPLRRRKQPWHRAAPHASGANYLPFTTEIPFGLWIFALVPNDDIAGGRGGAPAGPVKDDALPGLEEILGAFDQGLLWREIADRMPKHHQAARLTGASARNFIRPRVFDGLAGLVHLRLLRTGQATPDVAWSGQRPGLALPEMWEQGMDGALDAAVADTPDTMPLRSLLAGVGSDAAQ